MMYGFDPGIGQRREPRGTGDRAICPMCRRLVIAKCGRLVFHHWAHEKASDCDSWSEGETEWHRKWKECVPADRREVVIGLHRADIQLSNKVVVELQHSPISPDVIEEREQFYGVMVWLFDGTQISVSPPDDPRSCECLYDSSEFGTRTTWTCDRCRDQLQLEYSKFGVWIRLWKRRRKSWLTCQQPVFIDLGKHGILQLTKIENGIAKYGKLITESSFREWLSAQCKR